MEYIEVTCAVQLKKDMRWNESTEIIGNNINYALLNNQAKDFHKASYFKGYSFSNFYPAQKDGVYKKNNIYTFTINVIKQNHKYFVNIFNNYNSNEFKVLVVQEQKRNVRMISQLFTINPTVIRLDSNKVWTKGDLDILIDQINRKLIKKYKQFFGEELNCNFIEQIKVLSKSPAIMKYKNFSYAGIKLEIIVNQDADSQKLAQLAKITGIGDLNSSLGCGFSIAHNIY